MNVVVVILIVVAQLCMYVVVDLPELCSSIVDFAAPLPLLPTHDRAVMLEVQGLLIVRPEQFPHKFTSVVPESFVKVGAEEIVDDLNTAEASVIHSLRRQVHLVSAEVSAVAK